MRRFFKYLLYTIIMMYIAEGANVIHGRVYNVDLAPEVSFTDLNMDIQGITLNGDAYVSGAPVTSEGNYTLAANVKDKAGNTNQLTYNFTIDKTPPHITIDSPANQAIIPDIKTTIRGSVDDLTATFYYQDTLVNIDAEGNFSIDLPLTVGWNELPFKAADPVGNISNVALNLLSAPNPPAISFNVPAQVKAGETIGITVSAADEFFGITFMDIYINGYPVDHVIGDKVNKELSKQVIYTVPADFGEGENVIVRGQAGSIYNFVGNGEAQILVNGVGGIGVISGEVYNDWLGLPLAGVGISTFPTLEKGGQGGFASDPTGQFSFVANAGQYTITAEKSGWTKVERQKNIFGGRDNQLIDYRLTPLDSKINEIGTEGGAATNSEGRLSLEIPANALPGPLQLRITEISNQG